MKKYFLTIITGFLLFSCKDFIETDLTDKNVDIIAPQDNLLTTSAAINFYWEPLDGARQYRIQVASPSFDNMTSIVTDTLLGGTEFSYVLRPGNYQWRIRAQNGSSKTPYITRNITIDSTSDLSSQTIILLSPASEYATNSSSLTFSCYGLYNATHYRWALKTHASSFGGTLVLPDQLVADTFITVTGLPEGYLDWGMRGETSNSSTLYSSRSIYIDYTNPNAPALTAPANATTSVGPNFSLSWSRATDSGSPLYDSVYIYTSSSLSTIKRTYKITSGTSLSDTLADGTYYWRVKSIDKAGNAGAFSASRWFKLN